MISYSNNPTCTWGTEEKANNMILLYSWPIRLWLDIYPFDYWLSCLQKAVGP